MKIERKLYASVLAIMLILITFGSMLAVDRTITDTDDNISTFISNSNGGVWEATGANIQLAIDDLTSGGTVWLPDCNISVADIIEMDDDINLIGVGKQSRLWLPDATNKDVLQINGKSNSLISGICIHANGDAQTDNLVSCINIIGTSYNITIKDCYFYEGSKSLIDCQESTYNILIEGNHLDGKKNCGHGAGIWLSGKYCTVKDNFIQDTFGCGIVVEAATASPASGHHIIDGNQITGEISHGIHMEGSGGQAYYKANNCTIVNNQIYDINSSAFNGEDASPAYGIGIIVTENATCSNNIISNVHFCGIQIMGNNSVLSNNKISGITATGSSSAGIQVTNSYLSSTTLIGNTIDDVGLYGIYISDKCTYAGMTGNKITNTGNSAVVIKCPALFNDFIILNAGHQAIEVVSAENVTISDGMIQTCDQAAIYATGCEVAVRGVNIYNANTDNVALGTIHEATVIQNCIIKDSFYGIFPTDFTLITDNVIDNCGTYGIRLNGDDNCTISGNQIKGCTTGISISNSDDTIVTGNHVSSGTNGIIEDGTSTYTLCDGNHCRGVSGTGIDVDGTGFVKSDNIE